MYGIKYEEILQLTVRCKCDEYLIRYIRGQINRRKQKQIPIIECKSQCTWDNALLIRKLTG